MKNLVLLFSIYLAALTVWPCADGFEKVHFDDDISHASAAHEHDHDSEADGCSPLCFCQCCQTFFHLNTSFILSYPSNKLSFKINTLSSLFTSLTPTSLFRPPIA